jgi:hypothetical protein
MKFFNVRSLTKILLAPLLAAVLPLSLDAISLTQLEKIDRNRDHGFWLDENFRTCLPYGFVANVNFEQRWGANYNVLWYHSYELLLDYDLSGWFSGWANCGCDDSFIQYISLTPGFRQEERIRLNTRNKFHWTGVSIPLLDLNVVMNFREWTIAHRFRGEWNEFNRKRYTKYGDFRYRLELYAPWTFTCVCLRPYVSNEWFIRGNDTLRSSNSSSSRRGLYGSWYENRLRAGFTANLWCDSLTGAIYWQYRQLRDDPNFTRHWYDTYQWGLSLDFSF